MVLYMGGNDEATQFEWDATKSRHNEAKHGVSFEEARHAFADPNRLIFADLDHSQTEERLFCLGRTDAGVMTVRFTFRDNRIRIFGAGYWRKGKRIYDNE
jgi:uncharacterized DUF497 family protein